MSSEKHGVVQDVDLRQIFEPFGPVESIVLQKDPMGRSQGYGYVQYVHSLIN